MGLLRLWLSPVFVAVLWMHFSPLATVFCDSGKAIVTNRIKGAGAEPLYVNWGTGAGTAAAGDTTLFAEARSSATSGGNVVRVSGTSTRQQTTVANDTYQVQGTLTAEAGKTVTNAGLFDTDGAAVSPGPPSGGNLLMKGDFTGIALNANDSIALTMKLAFT